MIRIDDRFCSEYSNISEEEKEKLLQIKETIYKKDNMLDWIDISTCITEKELNDIIKIGNEIREKYDVFIIIGIGGSFLGSKAIIDALSPYFNKNKPEIIFLGYNLSSEYLNEVLEYIKDKNVCVNVISKSGNTLETDVAFQTIYKYLKENVSNYKERIIITTSKEKGNLRKIVNEESFRSFNIPDDVGGRFSVFTSVSLLPLAVAGINVRKLLDGVKDNYNCFNDASKLALIRKHLEDDEKVVEAITYYEEKLESLALWYQQLFAETQGKNNKGILPFINLNTTNLHSLGQYLQDGKKQVFETVLKLEKSKETNLYYNNHRIDNLNNLVLEQVAIAHKDDNTSSIIISIPELNEYYLGKLMYFLEVSSAIGAYLLDVYPFDQPGVEKYKENVKKVLN